MAVAGQSRQRAVGEGEPLQMEAEGEPLQAEAGVELHHAEEMGLQSRQRVSHVRRVPSVSCACKSLGLIRLPASHGVKVVACRSCAHAERIRRLASQNVPPSIANEVALSSR